MYGTVKLSDGPQAGTYVPVTGWPKYGFALEMPRHIDGGLFRRPRNVRDIYKIDGEQYGEGDAAPARFLGTVYDD